MDNKKIMIAWGGGLLALTLAFYLMSSLTSLYSPTQEKSTTYGTEEETLADSIRAGTAPIPPLTPEIQTALEKSDGFEALVSYTDRGFEPAEVKIKVGDTIRFTNNSGSKLWVSANGDTGSIYPYSDRESGCGSSDFDSCTSFDPQGFWEFTFTERGDWSFTNKADTAKVGVVMVRVE